MCTGQGVGEVEAILNRPDAGEDGLGKAPAADNRSVKSKTFRELVDPASDDLAWIGHPEQTGDRVVEKSPEVVARFTDDTFRINRQPSGPLRRKNVVVVQVAMQQVRTTPVARQVPEC